MNFDSVKRLLLSCFTVILFLSLVSASFLAWVHAGVNIFSAGRSDIKALLFLVWNIVMISLVRNRLHFKKEVSEKFRWIFLFSVICAYVINFISFIYFIKKYGFSWTEFIITFNNGEISSTQVVHNHVLKGVIGLMARWWNGGVHDGIDPGTAFLGLMPSGFLWFSAFAFVILFMSVIFFHIHSQGRFSGKRRLLYACLYIASSFVILKNFFDGGLFNVETLPALLVLCFLLFPNLNKFRITLGVVSSIVLLSLFFFLSGVWESHIGLLNYLYKSLAILCLFGVPLYFLEAKKVSRLGILFFIFTVILVASIWIRNLSVYQYTQRLIQEEAMITMKNGIVDNSLLKIDEIGDTAVYLYTPYDSVKIQHVLSRYKLRDNHFPVLLPWKNCNPRQNAVNYSFMVKTFSPFVGEIKNFDTIALNYYSLVSEVGYLYEYDMSLLFKPCVGNQLRLINEYMKLQGLERFFIYNLKINA